MEIKKPIFIVGSGRSGTTIFYNLIATHPELCWFSNYTNKLPEFPLLAMGHRLLEVPGLGKQLKFKMMHSKSPYVLKPMEAENIYHSYCKFRDDIKTTEEDLTAEMEYRLKSQIRFHLKYTGKKRFISKQTANNQRIRMIHKMFPDAYYIHIIRDGRAVANSLQNIFWWNNIYIWWLGYKPPKWKEMGNDPIELCALQWQRDVEEILNHRHLFGDRYIEIKYENFITDVKNTMNNIVDFCELKRSDEFENLLPSSLKDMNGKWKKLPESQKAILQNTTKDLLLQLGYM